MAAQRTRSQVTERRRLVSRAPVAYSGAAPRQAAGPVYYMLDGQTQRCQWKGDGVQCPAAASVFSIYCARHHVIPDDDAEDVVDVGRQWSHRERDRGVLNVLPRPPPRRSRGRLLVPQEAPHADADADADAARAAAFDEDDFAALGLDTAPITMHEDSAVPDSPAPPIYLARRRPPPQLWPPTAPGAAALRALDQQPQSIYRDELARHGIPWYGETPAEINYDDDDDDD